MQNLHLSMPTWGFQPEGFWIKYPVVGAKRRPPDRVNDQSHLEGVQEIWHAFSLRIDLNADPVVCGPPATICNASGVKRQLRAGGTVRSSAQRPPALSDPLLLTLTYLHLFQRLPGDTKHGL